MILEQIEDYYRNVSETVYDTFIENVKLAKHLEHVQGTLRGPLMCEDCKKIPETFENDKALGEDGFTVKFYTSFFDP